MLINFARCKAIINATHQTYPTKILHIGAHTGEEVEQYTEAGAQSIIWFEANHDLIPYLKENISRYRISQQIFPMALWSENTELEFNVTNNYQSSSFFNLGTHKEHYPDIRVTDQKNIKVYRLDALLASKEINFIQREFDFINIDTQGSELAILKGMGAHLESKTVKGIYLEVNRESVYEKIPLVYEVDKYLNYYNFSRVVTSWTEAGWGDAFYLRTIESN